MRALPGLILAVFVVFGLWPGGTALAGNNTYVNGIDFGFPPFAYVGKDGSPTGFDVESLDWIANRMGFSVRHRAMDWDQTIPALLAGKIDIIASGMTITEQRAKQLAFSIPYYEVSVMLLVRSKESAPLATMLEKGTKIGVQRGTAAVTMLEELASKPGANFAIVPYDTTELSVEDLKTDRIDGSVMDSAMAKMMLKSAGLRLAGTFDAPPQQYGYAMRKGDTDLQDKINQGLKLLMADPYWEQLKKKYNL